MSSTKKSLVRQNYHEESEAEINRQINMELHASYVYLSMAYYFDRDDVALKGFSKYFKQHSEEEREHADKLLKFQIMRGGRVLLKDIQKPTKDEWGSGKEAMEEALALERAVNESLLKVHACAEKHYDAHMDEFIEEDFLDEQVEDIKRFADHIANLERVGPGLGEYQYDQQLLKELEE